MPSCRYCSLPTPLEGVCDFCQELIDEALANEKAGVCSFCKGRATNLDGTPCDECEGTGLRNEVPK